MSDLTLKDKLLAKAQKIIRSPLWLADNIKFAFEQRNLKNQAKVFYTITPPPKLANVGDHAQAIAIRLWLEKHYSPMPIIEVDKTQSRYLMPALKWLVNPQDLIFLHSGGNLGDRGMWSEGIRRLVIRSFPRNKIVSLPQTIHFSDTEIGRREQENTRRIYARHPHLTVIGRDPRSGEIAKELFPKAETFCMPDFVLSLPPKDLGTRNNPPKVLLCLRLDSESALTDVQRQQIADSIPLETIPYDTTLDKPILIEERQAILEGTLNLFSNADVIVTDRYHGLIFTVLCQKPCVVLRTVDHKLTSAIHWFKDLPSIMFADNIDQVPELVGRCLEITETKTVDWNETYFDKLANLISIKSR
ncbi:MAG: polysaccharide pyruvyl transferase family protein [Cyanobacteria bacterium P01_A01_bin.40]